MITSHLFGLPRLWYHIQYHSIKIVWQMATIYKAQRVHITVYFLDIDVQKIHYKVVYLPHELKKWLLSESI